MRPLNHQSYFIELTNHCNMHCSFCPSDELKKRRQTSGEDAVEKCIRQIADLNAASSLVHFNVLGEPLLNKRIFDYIELCERMAVRPCVITNLSLLTKKNIEKLLSCPSLLLVLSVQTPTSESFKIRGYKHMDFDAYMATIERVILTKFKMQSEVWIEVHMAGHSAPSNLFRDSGKPLWSVYADESEQRIVVDQMIARCQEIAAKAQAMFPDIYDAASRPDYGNMDCTPLRENPNASEHEFWGWMFAPNVFLRVKEFGLWGLQENFLKKFLEPTEKLFIEEAEGSFVCPMAKDSFVMLADGQFTACCLDYDGEIKFGDIKEKTASQAFWSIDRSRLIENALSHPTCRRCKGRAYIFDTSPTNALTSESKMFGRGWHDYEPDLFGRGGRWTDGSGTIYFYSRSFVSNMSIGVHSPFPQWTELKLIVEEYAEDSGDFNVVRELSFYVRAERNVRVTLTLNLSENALYKARLVSPTFAACDVQKSADSRRLGLAVFGIEIHYAESGIVSGGKSDDADLEKISVDSEKTRLEHPTRRLLENPAMGR